jgi:hypothetical protein
MCWLTIAIPCLISCLIFLLFLVHCIDKDDFIYECGLTGKLLFQLL